MYLYYWDPTYILVLIGGAICLWASSRMKRVYRECASIHNRRLMSGAQVAREMMRSCGYYDIVLEEIPGELTDHYDPRKGALGLSPEVGYGTTIASMAIAAHECGHVIQHRTGYSPLSLRTAMVPVVNIGSNLAWPLILVALVLSTSFQYSYVLMRVGICLFALAVVFQLVTLPVEFNASRRALDMLQGLGLIAVDEVPLARKMLRAAALTYVAGAASAILSLLRILILFGGNRRRD